MRKNRQKWPASRGYRAFFIFFLQAAGIALLSLPCTTGRALAETRTISFYNVHTKENLTVTYKQDGEYDPLAMRAIDHIMRDWRRNELIPIDPRLIDLAYIVHTLAGSKKPLHLLSGYRSPVTNSALRKHTKGVAKRSQHILGQAMDVYMPDVPLSLVHKIALQLQRGGVGHYPKSGIPFLHLDIGSVRHWPRMSRQELVQIFPDGNSLHVPTDGYPLSPMSVKESRNKRSQLISAAPLPQTRGFPSYQQEKPAALNVSLPTFRNRAEKTDVKTAIIPTSRPLNATPMRVAEARRMEIPVPIPHLRPQQDTSPFLRITGKTRPYTDRPTTTPLRGSIQTKTHHRQGYKVPQLYTMISNRRVSDLAFAKLSAPKTESLIRLLRSATYGIHSFTAYPKAPYLITKTREQTLLQHPGTRPLNVSKNVRLAEYTQASASER
ncbi:MAG: DUF882 domain-containing protein [Alphaproteobacteria bacterium]|nr:DUF882 domain-containing protein [Alphaproteobacteria bacterium]